MSKQCEKCGSYYLSSIRSQYIKKCIDCGHEKKWPLKDDQKPLLQSNRAKS